MRKIRNYYGETYDFNTHIRVCLYSSIVKKYGLPKADTLKLDRLHNDSIVAGLHKHWSRKRLAQFDYTTLFDRPELKKHFQQECLSIFKYNEQQSLPTLSERWKQLRRSEYHQQQLAEHFEEHSQASDTNCSVQREEEGRKSDANKWLEFYATRTDQDLPKRPDRVERNRYSKPTYVSQHPKHSRRRKSHGRIRDICSSSSTDGENEEKHRSRFLDDPRNTRDKDVRNNSRGRLDSFQKDYRSAPSAQTYRPKSRHRSRNDSNRRGHQTVAYQERDHHGGDYWESETDDTMENSVVQFRQQFSDADNDFFQHDDRSLTRYPRARKRSPLVRRSNRRLPRRPHPSKFLDRHRRYLRSCVASSTLRTKYSNSQSRRRRRRSSSYSSDRTRTRSPSKWQHDLFNDDSSGTYSPMRSSDDSYLSGAEMEAEEDEGERSSTYSKLLIDYAQYKRRAKLFRYRYRWDDLRHKLDRRSLKNKFRRRYGPD